MTRPVAAGSGPADNPANAPLSGDPRRGVGRRAVCIWLAALSALPSLACGGETPPPTVDLEDLVVTFVGSIPGPGTDAMALPTEAQTSRFVEALRAAQAGDPRRAQELVAPLAYRVRTLADSVTRRRMYVFEERRTRGGEWPNGWGMYVIAAESARPLLVEVAHPVHDVNTPQVGVQAFRDGRAAALLVAGTHRYANRDGSSDVAHDDRTMFAEVNRALVRRGQTVLQPHGFDSSGAAKESDGIEHSDVVVSAGIAPPPAVVDSVTAALQGKGFAVCEYDGDRCADLGGTLNVEGEWCREVGATFVHLELDRDVRDDPTRRALAARTVVKTLGSVPDPS